MDHKENYQGLLERLKIAVSAINEGNIAAGMFDLGTMYMGLHYMLSDMEENDDCDCGNNEEETQEEIDKAFGLNKTYDERMMEMGKTLIEIIEKIIGLRKNNELLTTQRRHV